MLSEHWNYRETHPSTRNEGRGAELTQDRTTGRGRLRGWADGTGKQTWGHQAGAGAGVGGGVKQTNRNERGWGGEEGQSSGRERGGEREREKFVQKSNQYN